MAQMLAQAPPSAAVTLPPLGTDAAFPAVPLLDILVANRALLIKVARGFVGCHNRAEDVVHDVLLKLLALANQDAVRQPIAYVMRMVRNAAIDACRRQNLENIYRADEDSGLNMPSQQPSPEATLVVRDALLHVCRALDQLPTRCRKAFEMVRLCEETLQSTARALNVSQTLVHFMVRDAEQHCRACLSACNRGDAVPLFHGSVVRDGKKMRASIVD